jgi:Xaa-Pro aminopeptidase
MPVPLLISNLINIRYLTGLEMTAGVMLVTSQKRVLFVDDRYTEKAKKGVKRRKRTKGIKGSVQVLHVGELQEVVKRFKRVRFEADELTVARLHRWQQRFRGVKLVPSEGVIEAMRRQKKEKELRAIRKACAITDHILRRIPGLLTRRGVACYAPTG